MPVDEQGVTLDRYMLIPRTLIFLRNDHEVLLIKGAPTKRIWPALYNGIGGHIESGEDVLSAACRELQEETGLSSHSLRLCGTVTIDTHQNPGIAVFVFTGDQYQGILKTSDEGTLEWVDIDQWQQLPLVPDLAVLLPRVLGFKAGDNPFSAHTHYDGDGMMQVTFA